MSIANSGNTILQSILNSDASYVINASTLEKCIIHISFLIQTFITTLESVLSLDECTGNYIKLQYPFVCLSVCMSVTPPPPFDTTVGPQSNLAHLFA